MVYSNNLKLNRVVRKGHGGRSHNISDGGREHRQTRKGKKVESETEAALKFY
jgi:hypothetical protein